MVGALSGCQQPNEQAQRVTVIADGETQTIEITTQTTVADVLRQENIALNELDVVNPPLYSRIEGGMTITVKRIREEIKPVEESIPFERITVPTDTLPVGDEYRLQAGVNGVRQVTKRFIYEDGELRGESVINEVVIVPPVNEVVMVGSESALPAVTISGTIAYLSGGNAWIIRDTSMNRRALTENGGIDGRVFELSRDGEQLLFTRSLLSASPGGDSTAMPAPVGSEDQPFNSLWVILDTTDPASEAVRLDVNNVLYADWVPGTDRTIVYSTAEPRAGWPGWQANNDLWRAQISANGAVIRPERLLEPSCSGIYCWYATLFEFSPDGSTLAWAQPDAVGVLVPVTPESDPEETPVPTPTPSTPPEADALPPAFVRQPLLNFAPRNAPDNIIWVPSFTWSPDGSMLLATVHGLPLTPEASPQDSPVFNLTAIPLTGGYTADLAERAGIWSFAQFSPVAADNPSQDIQIAFLEAENPLDSFLSRYRLVVMDRDGSNRRVIFPPEDQIGLDKPEPFAWSPDGRQIVLIHQGYIFIIDATTGSAHQITADGLARSPRWTP